MMETIQCLSNQGLDNLSKYLRNKGYLCLPRIGYPNPFLNILIRNKNKNKLWVDVKKFEVR